MLAELLKGTPYAGVLSIALLIGETPWLADLTMAVAFGATAYAFGSVLHSSD
jgi:hypothetical protein